MPFNEYGKYTCIVCDRTNQSGGYRNESNEMKCKKCKGRICPSCQRTEESVKEDKCPKCGGEVYFPML